MVDPIKYGPRAPRQPGQYPATVPIGYLEITEPGPEVGTSIVDLSSTIHEDEDSSAVNILLTNETGNVTVEYDAGGPALPATNQSFVTSQPIQQAAALPIKILRIEQDGSGGWIPVVSRGSFYKTWTMSAEEGAGSWLRSAGFENGQTLALCYSTDLDTLVQSTGQSWNGLGMTAPLPEWTCSVPVQQKTSRTLNLLPQEDISTVAAVGGLRTNGGVELLAEQPRYTGATLLAPGIATLPLDQMTLRVFQVTSQDPINGYLRGTSPVAEGQISSTNILGTTTAASWFLDQVISSPASAANYILQFSGSVLIPTDGFYNFSFAASGKFRLFHWNVPVVDRWYGYPSEAVWTNQYTGYLHAGWHDLTFEWAPSKSVANITTTLGGPGTVRTAANITTRSQVQAIDTDTDTISLKQDYLATSSLNAPTLFCTFATLRQEYRYRGYRNNAGGFVSLDLNPQYGRYYGVDDGSIAPTDAPTSDWIANQSCYLYALPSMACALTDITGQSYDTGTRNWVPCMAASPSVRSTIRWGSVQGLDLLAEGIASTTPLGTLSSFETGLLGIATYSASGSIEGINGQPDPRGDYDSAVLLGRIDVVNGLADRSTVKQHDIRSRGGGLFQETVPAFLPTGGPQERARVFWDESPWDGYEGPVDGVAIFEIPSSVLDGSDGGPIFTKDEVEELVQKSVAVGIKPVIIYT